MAFHIEIISIDKDGFAGIISAKFRIHDDTDKVNGLGMMEKFTIGSLEIVEKYGGDVQRWIKESVSPQMLERHKSRTAIHTSLEALKGRKLKL
jgi:hypothetical protein